MGNVLGNLFGDIATAIREKTGDTDTMKPAEFPEKIREISGSSADVCYVTFMSYDGTVEYGKIPVAVGYDCPNPKFDTPTRESDVQYNYTHAGWATTPNGGLDSNALKAVNEDRTVYANFAAVVREYTISFYDEDGAYLYSKKWAYGATPSYTPTKDGYDFAGWEPALVPVTGDARYTATWTVKAGFETATWEEIAAICAAGNHHEYFSVGDSKPVTLTYDDGTSETINFTIVDMDVDPISQNEKAPLTIMAENIVAITPTVLHSAYNNGYPQIYNNDTAKACLAKIFAALPTDLQSVIKPYLWNNFMLLKYSEIFVPHSVNLGISHDGYGNPDTPIYNAEYKHFANGASIKRTKVKNDTVDNYWTSACARQTSGGNYTSYFFIAIDGENKTSAVQNGNSNSHGIVPCFCI